MRSLFTWPEIILGAAIAGGSLFFYGAGVLHLLKENNPWFASLVSSLPW